MGDPSLEEVAASADECVFDAKEGACGAEESAMV